MEKLKKELTAVLIFIVSLIITTSSVLFAQSGITFENEEQIVVINPAPLKRGINNPLKGFRPNVDLDPNEHHYNTIVRSYLKWNELERNANDGIEQIKKISDEKWKGLSEKNIKVIPRVYLDWDSKPGNEYWPEDMKPGPNELDSLSYGDNTDMYPAYSSEQFKQRLVRLIHRLGEAWDNDPRIAWVQMGLIGLWGEHHTPAPTEEIEKLMGDAFAAAFQHKKVLVRRPYETFEEYQFGWYWDSFAHWDQINSQGEQMLEKCPDRWETHPIEGEVAYNWGDYKIQAGSNPSETLQDPSHRKWVIDWIRKTHATGLGWIAEYDNTDPRVQAGAEQVQKAFGYRYLLEEVTYPKMVQIDQSFTVSFDITNSGSAPFYYDWPVELRLLDPESREVTWKQQFSDVDIRDWMPGEEWNDQTREYDIPAPVTTNEGTFTTDRSLPKGEYILALAILDPAGMVPSVKFATRQYFTGGNHPIGKIGLGTEIGEAELNPDEFDDPTKDTTLYYLYLSQ
ncbi:MAG: DUF4832 domain-containing protein [Balneolales bacterium]